MIRTLHTVLGEAYALGEDGRPIDSNKGGRGRDWRLVAAIQRKQNGTIERRYSADEILQDPSAIRWTWNGGRQRTSIVILRDGWLVEVRSPVHWII